MVGRFIIQYLMNYHCYRKHLFKELNNCIFQFLVLNVVLTVTLFSLTPIPQWLKTITQSYNMLFSVKILLAETKKKSGIDVYVVHLWMSSSSADINAINLLAVCYSLTSHLANHLQLTFKGMTLSRSYYGFQKLEKFQLSSIPVKR